MGIIMSNMDSIRKNSNLNSNSGIDVVRLEKMKVRLEPLTEVLTEWIYTDLHALFPPKVGDSSTNQSSERDTVEEIELRFSEFMNKGDCKESFTALKDCVEEAAEGQTGKCMELYPMLKKCMDARSDYYQPVLTLKKNIEERLYKEIEKEVNAFLYEEQEEMRKSKLRGD